MIGGVRGRSGGNEKIWAFWQPSEYNLEGTRFCRERKMIILKMELYMFILIKKYQKMNETHEKKI